MIKAHINFNASQILDFWFLQIPQENWFMQNDLVDEQIKQYFSPLLDQVHNHDKTAWLETPKECLAHIILLDQFPRNLFRGSPQSFVYDQRARAIARKMIEQKWDVILKKYERLFVYLPFEHSENLEDQDLSVALYENLLSNGTERDLIMLDYARKHRVPIEKFGRFPHRNKVLERISTAEEIAYLKEKPQGF